MKLSCLALVLATCLAWSGRVFADPPAMGSSVATAASKGAGTMSGDSHLRFFRPFSGSPILIVHYPWQLHADPSIEVQWLPDGEPEPASIRPLAFVDGYLKGDFIVDAERCRAEAETNPAMKTRSKAGIQFDINARRNSLNKSAVWVDCHLPKPEHKTEVRTAFCTLENWAVDGRTLYLDLPPEYYAQTGKLRFWMLRGKDTVWMETVVWPGLPSGDGRETSTTTGGAAKPGDRKDSQSSKSGVGGKSSVGATSDADEKAAPAAKPAKGGKKAQDEAEEDDPFAAPKSTKK